MTKALYSQLFLIVLLAGSVHAQDLQPRAFSPAPTGLNTVLVGYSNSQGNVFFDQALLIEDATGEVHGVTSAYVRTLGIFGKLAKFSTVIPIAWGEWEGLLDGVPASTSRRGLADPRVQLAVNFIGSPAVPLKDFTTYSEGTIVGASVLAVVPLGQYDPSKLINLGSNRWAIRPRVGFSSRINRLTLEAMVDAWLFTENSEAFGETVISQDPILAIHGNIIYLFKRGLWLGVSGGMSDGGSTTVNGIEKDNDQRNSRLAGTLAVPVNRRLSLRLFYINSVKTRLGADFNFINVSVQYTWGGGF
jgi:hypothetical protein